MGARQPPQEKKGRGTHGYITLAVSGSSVWGSLGVNGIRNCKTMPGTLFAGARCPNIPSMTVAPCARADSKGNMHKNPTMSIQKKTRWVGWSGPLYNVRNNPCNPPAPARPPARRVHNPSPKFNAVTPPVYSSTGRTLCAACDTLRGTWARPAWMPLVFHHHGQTTK